MSSGASQPEDVAAPLLAAVVPLVRAWRLDRAFDYRVPPALESRVSVGCVVRTPLGGRRVRGVVVKLSRRVPERSLQDLAGVVLELSMCPPALLRVMEWIALRYVAPRAAAFQRVVPPRVHVEAGAPTAPGSGPAPSALLHLSGGAELAREIATGGSGTWCLRSLPRSDGARLTAELVSCALEARTGAALVAVPEVRFGSRVLDELARSWPGMARVDSARPDGERAAAWIRLARGERVGGGGRAAVLAPSPELRLVVLVDEHHLSYKEPRTPKFDARRVARERARVEGAVCVLLSSSPSLETGYAASTGGIASVEPTKQAARAARPVVEFAARPADRVLSHKLHRRVGETLQAGGRVALLAAARGYAGAVWCSACRRSLRCPRCESGMALDRSTQRVRCPRCGDEAPTRPACPSCGASSWRYIGAGSARLAEQVARAWPRARVLRADPETIEDEARSRRAADIYVTTWVGTKPEVRPDVSLVGVLDADRLLRRPDWRATEDAYQALAEMAEWAGPAAAGGRLLMQCSEPGHYVLQAIARADYGFWLRHELAQRRELGYPPFAELVAARATGPRAEALIDAAARASRSAGGSVLGPVADPRGEGFELLVKCPDAERVARGLRDILPEVPPGSRLSVDVDPRARRHPSSRQRRR